MPAEMTIDPRLQALETGFNVYIADAINKAILDTRVAVLEAAPVESGQTRAVFQVVSLASPGNLTGGIGQMERVGDPFAKAPPDTITKFLEWYRGST